MVVVVCVCVCVGGGGGGVSIHPHLSRMHSYLIVYCMETQKFVVTNGYD